MARTRDAASKGDGQRACHCKNARKIGEGGGCCSANPIEERKEPRRSAARGGRIAKRTVNFVEEAAISDWNIGELYLAARRLHLAHHPFDDPRPEGVEPFYPGDIEKGDLRELGV